MNKLERARSTHERLLFKSGDRAVLTAWGGGQGGAAAPERRDAQGRNYKHVLITSRLFVN